jgi:hypothetical protein
MRTIDTEETCCRKVNQSMGTFVYNVYAVSILHQQWRSTFLGNTPRWSRSSETVMLVKWQRFDTEEQLGLPFLITRYAYTKMLHRGKIFTKST